MQPIKESGFLLLLKFVSALALSKYINYLCAETFSSISLFFYGPLFSCIVTFCTLIFLYLPHLFWKIVFSPVLILTGFVLLAILRVGAIQRSENEQKENLGESEPIVKDENKVGEGEKQGKPKTNSLEQVHHWITSHSEIKFKSEMGFDSNSCFEESFAEWDVKAPLEVIFEENEGEESTQDPSEKQDNSDMGILRCPLLSRYYPESDSDNSSESGFPAIGNWDSPENIYLRWDEEDREGLIEIALDGCKERALEFPFEEENLIEIDIDISPTRYREFPREDEVFPGTSCMEGFKINLTSR